MSMCGVFFPHNCSCHLLVAVKAGTCTSRVVDSCSGSNFTWRGKRNISNYAHICFGLGEISVALVGLDLMPVGTWNS